MAGDWIKLQKDTFDKPEVLAIAARLGLDQDAVVGKLCRIWSWFDTHTHNGDAECVTFAFFDRLTGVTGFTEQVALVGWIHQNGHTLTLQNFDYHNGKTSKTRAMGKNRTETYRSNANSNAPSVTKASPEKRREEKSNTDTSAPQSGADDLFETFWKAYPKKVGKDAARKAFDKRKPNSSLVDAMLTSIENQKNQDQWIKDGGQFIPHPATWIGQGRWQDGESNVKQYGGLIPGAI